MTIRYFCTSCRRDVVHDVDVDLAEDDTVLVGAADAGNIIHNIAKDNSWQESNQYQVRDRRKGGRMAGKGKQARERQARRNFQQQDTRFSRRNLDVSLNQLSFLRGDGVVLRSFAQLQVSERCQLQCDIL